MIENHKIYTIIKKDLDPVYLGNLRGQSTVVLQVRVFGARRQRMVGMSLMSTIMTPKELDVSNLHMHVTYMK